MSPRAWRLFQDGAGEAAWNMSVDEALLLEAPEAGPALRLYEWREPSVSLGLRQAEPRWLGRCTTLGVPVVRRVSGGGAVLHAGDLTYCVVAPLAAPELPADLRGSYEWIRARLIRGLELAGLSARRSLPATGADRLELCFAGATGYEVELDGAKLVGSAQRRGRRAFLQHGSIRLADDTVLYRAIAGEAPPAPKPPGIAPGALRLALAASFAEALGHPLALAELSTRERALADERSAARRRCPLLAPSLVLRSSPELADTQT